MQGSLTYLHIRTTYFRPTGITFFKSGGKRKKKQIYKKNQKYEYINKIKYINKQNKSSLDEKQHPKLAKCLDVLFGTVCGLRHMFLSDQKPREMMTVFGGGTLVSKKKIIWAEHNS